MNVLRLLAACCSSLLLHRLFMSGHDEQAFGHTLVIAGAIIFAGLLIHLAINERR